jgi:hypothetical protein
MCPSNVKTQGRFISHPARTLSAHAQAINGSVYYLTVDNVLCLDVVRVSALKCTKNQTSFLSKGLSRLGSMKLP